jgi:hypothetical protein
MKCQMLNTTQLIIVFPQFPEMLNAFNSYLKGLLWTITMWGTVLFNMPKEDLQMNISV